MALGDVFTLFSSPDTLSDLSSDHPDKCAECEGLGAVDSGASDPQGNFYMEMCSLCHGTGRESYVLLDWAVSLLCSATCNPKFGDESKQGEWANGFGKWFAETQNFLSKSRKGLAKATQPEDGR